MRVHGPRFRPRSEALVLLIHHHLQRLPTSNGILSSCRRQSVLVFPQMCIPKTRISRAFRVIVMPGREILVAFKYRLFSRFMKYSTSANLILQFRLVSCLFVYYHANILTLLSTLIAALINNLMKQNRVLLKKYLKVYPRTNTSILLSRFALNF